MRLMTRLFTKSVHVKPTAANRDDARWLVITQTPLQAFIDEVFRYGWRVAIYNLKAMLQ